MKFIIVSVIAYFLISIQVVLDKFLLSSRRVSHPGVYAFYTGILSLASFILIPAGVYWSSAELFFQYTISGIIFIYGVLFLFFALRENEASRVMPVVGAIIPIVTYALSLIFFEEILHLSKIFGVALLIGGGFLVSWKMSDKHKRRKLFKNFSHCVLAGILLAIASIMFKEFYRTEGFFHVFVWTRLGLAIGALSLLVHPLWRKIIIRSFHTFKKSKRAHASTGGLFVGNKVLGGAGSIFLHYAISLGSVTVVNALVSVEYVLIFAIGLGLSVKLPKIFHEQYRASDIIEKVVAIIIITAGVVLVAVDS